MKVRFLLLLPFLFTALLFGGCIKDSVKSTYTYTMYLPVLKSLTAVRAEIKSAAPLAVSKPGKLFIIGNYIFLNEVEKGIHIIDNSTPAQPRNLAFIPIPGNIDMAVKDNMLYADMYSDLIAMDITNPKAIVVTKILEKVFPDRMYYNYYGGDSAQVVVDWIKKDTVLANDYGSGRWQPYNNTGVFFAASYASDATPSQSSAKLGLGGSMARFSIVGNRLYTVDYSKLNVFSLQQPATPAFVTDKQIGFAIETIFPFKDKLFIGSTTGTFIYDIANPDAPVQLSQFTHVRSCDPIITDGKNAYVTLRSGSVCAGDVNRLDILNVENLQKPEAVKSYNLSNPHGLSKDGDILFICDGTDGLKIYNATHPEALQLLKHIKLLETYDVIAYNKRAFVVAKDGLYQFDYTDLTNIRQVSKINIAN